jgi:DnaJ-class molecular chaperone
VLSDPRKKAAYDSGHDSDSDANNNNSSSSPSHHNTSSFHTSHSFGSFFGPDPKDIFGSFFGHSHPFGHHHGGFGSHGFGGREHSASGGFNFQF